MHTICLFGNDYASPTDVHLAIKRLLNLPEYYGLNADALNDCLSEIKECPAMWFRTEECTEDVKACLLLTARVFMENGAKVKEM